MLKFIADVNVEKSIVDSLRNKGCDVLWVPDYNCKATDEDILYLANKEERILLTNDKDFGEIVFFQKKIAKGIILFRIKGQEIEKKIHGINELLTKYQSKIDNYFIVISDHKIRFSSFGDING